MFVTHYAEESGGDRQNPPPSLEDQLPTALKKTYARVSKLKMDTPPLSQQFHLRGFILQILISHTSLTMCIQRYPLS